LSPTFALRIPGSSPAAKAAVVIVGAIPALAVWTALALTIALFGLHQVTAHFRIEVLPDWLWYYRHDPKLHDWLVKGYGFSGVVVLFGLVLFLRTNTDPALHGLANFATEAEIAKAGLRETKGILLARHKGRFLYAGAEAHVLLEAPTGSGKGVGIVIPNLLNWVGSVVCLDIKRENFTKTAGFRRQSGQAVHLFDPLDPDGATAHYNPLEYIKRADESDVINELQKVASMLFPTPQSGETFWAEAARTGFIGVGAYVAATPELPFTIGQIYRDLTEGSPQARFPVIIKDREGLEHPLSSFCVTALTDFCSGSDKTFSSVKQTITSRLGLWLNPRVDQATSSSDFDLRDLRTWPMSIYLAVSPNNIDRVAPLYNLIFQQLVDLNTDPEIGEFEPKSQKRVLVLLDEFARLGHAPVIVAAIPYVRSFGLNLLIVVQTRAQLRRLHGDDGAEDIVSNSDVEVVYTPGTFRDAKETSERLGTHGLAAKSKSRSAGWFGKSNNSISESEQSRSRMLPQEVQTMSLSDVLIFKRGTPPIKATKLLYYKMAEFTKRLLAPPKVTPRAMPNPPHVDGLDRFANEAGAKDRPITSPTGLTDAQLEGLERVDLDALTIDASRADIILRVARGIGAATDMTKFFNLVEA